MTRDDQREREGENYRSRTAQALKGWEWFHPQLASQ